jgi:uncharacterized protein (TIGR02246 family)
MTTDAETTARAILRELEDSLATHDLPRMLEFWTNDAVLIGDDSEHWDRASTEEYLGVMASMAPTVRWQWGHVAPVFHAPGVVAIAAAGAMTFVDASGTALGEPEPFRMTCVAVQRDGSWQLAHFHGSAPRPG